MRILFINHSVQNCGVADYGRRVFDILKAGGMDITTDQSEVTDIALFNYHHATMPNLVTNGTTKNVALFHEGPINANFDQLINVSDLPRPLFEIGIGGGFTRDRIVIGSFGFGFPDKDFPRVCQIVKNQYEKAEVRLNIPFAEFGDKDGSLAKVEVEKCERVLQDTNIVLKVDHTYLEPHVLLGWLSLNDINLFLYKESHGRGISSATDYALSVKKPIGISSSEMFRHLPREICVDNCLLKDLTIDPLKKVYEENSNAKLVEKIKELLQ